MNRIVDPQDPAPTELRAIKRATHVESGGNRGASDRLIVERRGVV
jgi:hypothetical protein